MGLKSPFSNGTRPVPGGKSQKGVLGRTPKPRGGNTRPAVGRGRGIVGAGTPDVKGRTPAEQAKNPAGNYGGGFAGKLPGDKRPANASPKGVRKNSRAPVSDAYLRAK